MANIDTLKQEHIEKYSNYCDFCKELVNQINFLLQENEIITGFPLEFRVKSFESMQIKIERNNLEISSIEDINDFAGIRIICLFYKDLTRIEQLLTENFIIHKKEDTINRLSDNTFGYGSIHFEVSPKIEWLKIPTFKKHANCKAEIQLRTGAQHIWAAVSHVLQYKKELDIPLELRRTITRVAALLETVDLEFERVENERAKYINTINVKSSRDELLNIENLKFILDSILPAENKSSDERYSELLDDLIALNIKKTTELENLLRKHLKSVKKESDDWLKHMKIARPGYAGVGYNHSGIVRYSLRREIGQKAEKYFSNQSLKK